MVFTRPVVKLIRPTKSTFIPQQVKTSPPKTSLSVTFTPQPQSALLSLPAEIRESIWAYAISGWTFSLTHKGTGIGLQYSLHNSATDNLPESERRFKIQQQQQGIQQDSPLAPLLACKQIYTEGLHHLYRSSTFAFTEPRVFIYWSTHFLHPSFIPLISSLSLRFCPECWPTSEVRAWQLLQSSYFPALTHLSVTLWVRDAGTEGGCWSMDAQWIRGLRTIRGMKVLEVKTMPLRNIQVRQGWVEELEELLREAGNEDVDVLEGKGERQVDLKYLGPCLLPMS